MTKEETINGVYERANNQLFSVPKQLALIAMDEYASHIAISFAEWIAENANGMYDYHHNLKYWVTGRGIDEKERTTAELYTLYLETNINKQK